MATRESNGPLQILNLDVREVNYMLARIRQELDELRGLRGAQTQHAAVTFSDTVTLNSAQYRSTAPTDVTEEAGSAGISTLIPRGDHQHFHGNLVSTPSLHDHGVNLDGLTDDDHTQYGLLAGRSGGQALDGGTDASDDLTLDSTAHATKGLVISSSNFRFGVASGAAGSRLVGRGEHTSAPATSLATGEWEITLYDNGVAPVVRFRYNDGGVTKTVDVGPLV